MRIKCHRIVGGQAVGDAIITRQPINFLRMLNSGNGNITDQNHDLFGKSVKGTVLVFPKAIGKQRWRIYYLLFEIYECRTLAWFSYRQTDIITASGCAISNLPLVKLTDEVPVLSVQSKLRIVVDANNETLFVIKK